MSSQRHVRLFRNGCNQAVRIPRDMELPGTDAVIHKDGDRLILEPAQPTSLLKCLQTLSPIEEAFGEIADPAPPPVTL